MGPEIYKLILIALTTMGASYVQGITGFGFGIIAMIFLPSFLLYTEANLVSSILGALTALLIVIATFKKINWKNLLFPMLGSVVTNYLSIEFVKASTNDTLILLLGIALFILSIYFFFFSDKIRIKATWYAGLIAGALSGIMSGLFSIGGPPVVIYYLQSEEDSDSYLATISLYFVLSGAISSSMKIMSGFMTANALWGILIGTLAMAVGTYLGKHTRDKTKPAVIKKLVYGVMAISGLINIITSII